VELCDAGGDPDMAAYGLVRQALVTLYRRDAAATVALARQAGDGTGDARIRGLAAQREAQGHALAGDASACFRAIERAAELLATAATDGGPVLGSAHVADAAAATTGWCLHDLGQPARAADVLQRELDRIPAHAERARARYGARLALALATGGEPEQACTVLGPTLAAYERVGSATVRADLRALARTLNRWPTHAAITPVRLRLTAALRPAAVPVT
jgi:hypothetical protein